MRLWLLVAMLAASAAADGFKSVERKDWVADWDKYVAQQAATTGGKLLKYRSPARTARREIILRPAFDADVASGRRLLADQVRMQPPDLLAATLFKLKPLEVIELSVDDAQVRGLEISGEAALVFWTLSDHHASTVYLQGRHPGHSELRVTRSDGGVRLFQIDVP